MMNIYVANLAEYNSGNLVGSWIALPLSENELHERLNDILGNDEELAIHDYECDYMQISEYDNIFKLNEVAENMNSLSEHEQTALKAMLGNGYNFEEALQKTIDGDFRIYHDCQNMAHVAMELENEIGGFSPDTYERYIDIDALARDLEIEYYSEDEEDYPDDFTDYAWEVVEAGINQEILERYFDYEAFGRDLDIEGYFFFIDGVCIEVIN